MKFTPQRMKILHSVDGVNYSLNFFREKYFIHIHNFIRFHYSYTAYFICEGIMFSVDY